MAKNCTHWCSDSVYPFTYSRLCPVLSFCSRFICLFPSAPSLTPSKVKASFCSHLWPYIYLQLYVCRFCVNPQTSSAYAHLFMQHQITVKILHLLSLNFKFFLCMYRVCLCACIHNLHRPQRLLVFKTQQFGSWVGVTSTATISYVICD